MSNLPPPPGSPSGPWDGTQSPDWSLPPGWSHQAPQPQPGQHHPQGYGYGRPPERLESIYYSPGIVILLTIVTCGIWSIVWSYRTNEDLKRYNGDGLGGGLAIVLCILVSVALMFTIPSEIEKMYQRDGRQSPVSAMIGLWFLLPIIGNFIWYFKVQGALNDFWTSKGSQPA